LAGDLGEEVVGDSYRELASVGEGHHCSVIVGEVLEPSRGVDGAGKSETIELAQEVTGGAELVIGAEGRALGQGRVQQGRCRCGEQQPRRVPGVVAHDVATGRVGCVPRVSNSLDCRPIEQG
jgi:hypothetical protein